MPSRYQHGERLTQHLFDARFTHVGFAANALERASCFAFAKTERAQRAECLFMDRRRAGTHHGTIATAIGVPKHEPRRDTTFDDELPAVLGPVMRGA